MLFLRRRDLLAAGPAAVLANLPAFPQATAPKRPVVVASSNGLRACKKAMEMITAGSDVLDAVIAGVNIQEDDPEDSSVGYGGLPNEEGEVELDASVMHGPTARAGAVAGLKHIKNPSKVARLVMERTDHIMLVGEGALRFALAHGFPKENLLTEKSRLAWMTWRENRSDRDAWGPGLAAPDKDRPKPTGAAANFPPEVLAWAQEVALHPPTGTINCIGVDAKGDISGVTTTSGLAWKIPGRIGDSPIIGAGVFVDNAVGAAGSTGRGEENIRVCGAHTVVEFMRKGASPTEACLEALRRVAANYSNDRNKLARFDLNFYALNKKGEFGGAALWDRRGATSDRRPRYAVNDGGESRLVESASLLKR